MMAALCRPPPVTSQRVTGTGKNSAARATAATVKAASVAAPAATESP